MSLIDDLRTKSPDRQDRCYGDYVCPNGSDPKFCTCTLSLYMRKAADRIELLESIVQEARGAVITLESQAKRLEITLADVQASLRGIRR